MATEFCQKCKQSHPGRVCDYDDLGECAETIEASNDAHASDLETREQQGGRRKAKSLTAPRRAST